MFPRIDSSSPPLPESRQNNNNSNNSNSNELHGSSRSGGMEGAACSTSSNKFSLPSSARHKRRSVSSHNCDSKNNTTGRRGVLRAADKPLTVDRLLEAAVGEENTFNQSLLQLLPSPVGSNHNSNNNNNNNNNNNVFASSSVCSSPSKRASYQRAIRVPPVVTDRRPSGAAAAALMVHSPSANSISNFMSLIPSAPSPRIVGANDSISSAASSIRRRCRAAPHMVPSISGRRQMNSDGDYSPVERTPPPLPSIPMRSPSKATTAAAVAHVPNSRSVSCCTTHSSASAREAACYYGNEPSSDAPMGLDALSATTPNHNSKLNNVYETDNLSYCSPLSPHDLREAAARRYAEDNNNNNTTASTNRSNNVIYSVVDSPHISPSYREALTPSAVFGAAAARSSFRCSNPLHNSTAVSHSSMSSMGAVMMRSGDMGMMLHRGGGAGGCSTPAFVSQPLPTPPEKPFQGVVPARRELGVRRDGVRAAPQSNWSDADGSSAAATLESPSCTPSKKSSNNNNYTFDRLRYRGEAAGISSARSLSSLSSAPSASGLKRADRKVYASGANNNNNNNSHHTHHKQHCGYSGHSTTHYFFYKGNREQGNCLPPHRQVVTDAPFSPIGGDADCHTRKTLADHNNNNHSNSVAAAGEDSVLFYEDADTNAMEEIGQRLRRYLQQVSSASVSTADVHGNPTVAVPAADDYLHVNHATKNALKPIESLFRIFPVDDELDAAQGQFHLSDYYAPCQVCMQSKKDRKLKKKRNRNRDSSFYWGGGGGMLTGLEDSGDLTCDAYSCCSCSYCEVKLNGGASVQQQEEKEEEENNEASVSIKRQQRSSSPPPAPLVDECVCGCTYCQKHRRSTRKKLKPQTGNAALPATNNPGKAAHHRSHPTRFAQIDKNCDNNNNNNNKYNCNDDEALYGDREAVPRTATPNIMCIDLGNDNYYYVDPKHAVGGAKLIAQAVLLEDQKQKQKEKKCDASPRKWHRQHHRHGYLINMRALLDQSNNGTPIGEHNNNNNKRERYACDADEEAHVEPHPACPYAHCHNSTNDKEEDDEDDEYDVNHIGKDASLRNNVPHRSRGKHTPRRSLKETKTFASPFLPSFPDAAATTITTDENESDYYYHTDGASSPYIGGTAIVKDCGLFSDGQQQQQQQQCVVRHTCGPDDCDVHACGAAVLAEEAARKKKSSKCLEVPPPILAGAHDVAATTKLNVPWNHGDDRSRDDNSNAVVQDAALGQRYVDAAEELEGGGMFFLPTFASPLQGPNVEGKR